MHRVHTRQQKHAHHSARIGGGPRTTTKPANPTAMNPTDVKWNSTDCAILKKTKNHLKGVWMLVPE